MNNQLQHYGILGMKWGVHRRKNKVSSSSGNGKAKDSNKKSERAVSKIDKALKTPTKKVSKKTISSGKSRVSRFLTSPEAKISLGIAAGIIGGAVSKAMSDRKAYSNIVNEDLIRSMASLRR